jgi:hypothetical protein
MMSSAGMPGVDPSAVHTPDELSTALDGLRRRRGLSYSGLARRAAELPSRDGKRQALPKSTVGDMLRGKVSSREKLLTFLDACRVSALDRPQWVAAWERARTADVKRPSASVRVREAQPRDLGVHAAIRVYGSTGELPPYVARDVDAQLGADLEVGASQGCFVLMVGGSSVGKTRTLYEAVRRALPDWWLFCPADVAEIDAFSLAPTPRTVLWLDEIQRYFAEGLSPSSVRRLRSWHLAIVIAATMWPDQYHEYRLRPAPGEMDDSHRREREVLEMAHVFDVPQELSPTERSRAAAVAETDPRIKAAIGSSYGLTQALAAAPELVRRWVSPPDKYGWALITAAIDARRLGATDPLPSEFLRSAGAGYLGPSERATAPSDWFEHGLGYAAEPLYGAAAALNPVGTEMGVPVGYVVADFLDEYGRHERQNESVPLRTWEALVKCVESTEDRYRLTYQADRRHYYRLAVRLVEPLADQCEPNAMRWMIHLMKSTEQQDEASRWQQQAGVQPHSYEAMEQWRRLKAEGRTKDARRLLQRSADAGDIWALRSLAEQAESEGRLGEAEDLLYTWAAAVGPPIHNENPYWQLVRFFLRTGQLEAAEQQWRGLIRIDDIPLWLLLDEKSLSSIKPRFPQEREWLLRYVVDEPIDWYHVERAIYEDSEIDIVLRYIIVNSPAHAPHAMVMMAEHMEKTGRAKEAETWWQRAVDAENSSALLRMADRASEAGDHTAAEGWTRRAAEAGDAEAIWRLIQILERAPARSSECAAWWARVRDLDDRELDSYLAWQLSEAGRTREAEALLRRAVDAGDRYAIDNLVRVLQENGKTREAESWIRRAIDLDSSARSFGASVHALSSMLKSAGRSAEAERLKRFGLEPGGATADPWYEERTSMEDGPPEDSESFQS